MRVAVLGLLLCVSLLAWAIRERHVVVSDRWWPWATLGLDEEPGVFTRFKLARLSDDGERCFAVLATAPLEFEPLTDRETGQGCGFHDAVRIDRTTAAVGEPFTLTCRAAVSLALWERHVLQPAAAAYFGEPVAVIEHFGSYACRNVYNRPNATRSRHATADAFDVAGFVLADGRRIRVVNDWTSDDARERRFLHDVRDGACRFFDTVLSPDYNAAHRDHLHLDRGSYGICR
jgi:hypothetical protein